MQSCLIRSRLGYPSNKKTSCSFFEKKNGSDIGCKYEIIDRMIGGNIYCGFEGLQNSMTVFQKEVM